MRLYEFVGNVDDIIKINNNDNDGNGGGNDDDDGGDGGDDYGKRFDLIFYGGTLSTSFAFDFDVGSPTFIINYTHRSYEEWRDAGKPQIRSLGDASRNDKYYIGFTDIRAMNYLRNTEIKNVSKEPNKMFVMDFLQDVIIETGRLDNSFFSRYFIDTNIHGDVLEACTDEFIKVFKDEGFTSLVKLKDYLK